MSGCIPKGVHIIFTFAILSSLLADIFPFKRVPRIFFFLGLLNFVALSNSFGKINHGWHAWLWVSFILILIPRMRHSVNESSRQFRQRTLLVFWACQAIVLLFYSLAGGWKVAAGILQWSNGEINTFSPEALAMHTADRLIQTESQSLLGSCNLNTSLKYKHVHTKQQLSKVASVCESSSTEIAKSMPIPELDIWADPMEQLIVQGQA